MNSDHLKVRLQAFLMFWNTSFLHMAWPSTTFDIPNRLDQEIPVVADFFGHLDELGLGADVRRVLDLLALAVLVCILEEAPQSVSMPSIPKAARISRTSSGVMYGQLMLFHR